MTNLLLCDSLVRDPRADYQQSLEVLKQVKRLQSSMVTKTSLMLGLGETDDEVLQTMKGTRMSINGDYSMESARARFLFSSVEYYRKANE